MEEGYIKLFRIWLLFYVCEGFTYMYACASSLCLEPGEAGKGHQVPGQWGYR